MNQTQYLAMKLKAAEATIQRVRDVHQPVAHNFMPKRCQCGRSIPCPTIQALEGDQK